MMSHISLVYFLSFFFCREIHLADVCRSCRRLCALVIRLAALPRCLSSQFGKLHLTAAQQHQQCPRHSSAGRPAFVKHLSIHCTPRSSNMDVSFLDFSCVVYSSPFLVVFCRQLHKIYCPSYCRRQDI